MKKISLILFSFFVTSSCIGQIGFLGKRNVVSTDLFNTFFQKKYNLNYDFCLGKSFMVKASYSLFRDKRTLLSYGNNNLAILLYDYNKAELNLKGHSWETGIIWSYYNLTNMPMPFGYYMGLSYEHFSGNLNEIRITNTNFPNTKEYDFTNKANIFKIIYGRNSYLQSNFIIDLSLEVGIYAGSSSNNNEKVSLIVLPFSCPINKYRRKYDSDIYDREKHKKVTFYLMPNIKIGYIF